MRGYPQGILDFCKLRLRGRAAADFEDVAVVLLRDQRDALLGALLFEHVLGCGDNPVGQYRLGIVSVGHYRSTLRL